MQIGTWRLYKGKDTMFICNIPPRKVNITPFQDESTCSDYTRVAQLRMYIYINVSVCDNTGAMFPSMMVLKGIRFTEYSC